MAVGNTGWIADHDRVFAGHKTGSAATPTFVISRTARTPAVGTANPSRYSDADMTTAEGLIRGEGYHDGERFRTLSLLPSAFVKVA
jgi:hypothetical protein